MTGYRVFRTFPPLLDLSTLPTGPVLAVAPHPDDEIIGCGGMLAFHRERGDDVRVVHVTGGEQGDPRALEGGDLVAVRRAESLAAAREIGLEGDCLVELEQPDGALQPTEAVVGLLRREVERYCPVLVYAPSPMECHRDHLATCWAVGEALRGAPVVVRLLGYEINHPTLASFLCNVTPWIERKREALTRFRSQQRYQDVVGKCLAGAYARTVNVELPDVQYAEAFLELEPQELPRIWNDLEVLSQRLGIAVAEPAP